MRLVRDSRRTRRVGASLEVENPSRQIAGSCLASSAVFVRGELLGIYAAADVATRDMYIAVAMEQASREDLARAFRVSVATLGRVRTRFNEGGARAVADYGRRGGWTVRTPRLVERLWDLSEKGLVPRAAHAAVAKQASYGTVHVVYREWEASAPRSRS